jgi:DNA ligase (NAD+)
MQSIIPPNTCPSCDFKLTWVGHMLYCKNSECFSQLEKKIQHFAKCLKIKGLGPATISKLNLTSLVDLYSLSKNDLAIALSSEKVAEKLYHELENSKNAPLNKLLPAFSIPLIGDTASEKLSKICVNIYDIDEFTCREAGLGPKATESLLSWLKSKLSTVANLPFSFKFEHTKIMPGTKDVICISGKLKSYKTKGEAATILSDLGYIVKPTLTKEVTILVNESGIESAKTKQAQEKGILIVTNLRQFIGE